MSKISFIVELSEFLWQRKKWWLATIILALVLLGGLIFVTQGATSLPFLYALF